MVTHQGNNVWMITFRTGYARITHGGLSDTEVQVGRFEIPDSAGYKDNVKTTTEPEDVPEHVRFSQR